MKPKTLEEAQMENIRLHQHISALEQALEKSQEREVTLRRNETHLRTIIERNPDATMVTSDGIVRFVNPAAEVLFGRTATEMIGNEIGIPIVAEDKTEVELLDKQGQQRVAEMRVVEIDWQGIPSNLISFRDITTRKHFEREMERRVEERTALLRHTAEQLSDELAEREKAEKAILRRDAILEAIEFAAHRFLKATSFVQEIAIVLEYLGKATLVSKVMLFVLDTDGKTCSLAQRSAAWISPNLSSSLNGSPNHLATASHADDPSRSFARWREQLGRGFAIHGDVRTFPPEERRVLEQEAIQSLVVVPVFVEHEWWGFIEFDEYQPRRAWLLAEVEALRAAASIIGTACQHEQVLEALRTSEERFRMVADFTYDWEYWLSAEGDWLYVSPSCERVTGYCPDEFQARPDLLLSITHPDDRRKVSHLLQETPDEMAERRFRIITRGGDIRWIGQVYQTVYGADGRWLGQRGSNRDITDQVQIEEYLKREQLLFVGGPVVVFKWIAAETWPVEYVSPNVSQFGYDAMAFTSGDIPYTHFIYAEDLERVSEEVRMFADEGVIFFEQDYRVVRADGEVRWIYDFTRIIRNEEGTITHYDGYILDITDRKQMDDALRDSEKRFRSFVEGTDNLFTQVNEQGQLVYVNSVAERFFGLLAEECIGKSSFDFVHPDDRERTRLAFSGWLRNRATGVTFENRQMSQTGAVHHVIWTINLHYHDDGSIASINGIARDISEYKRVEQALRESESRYRVISDLVSDFAYALRVEPDDRVVLEWVTDAFARMTGYTLQEVEDRGGWDSLVYPDDLHAVRQSRKRLLDGQRSDENEFRILTGSNEMRWFRNHCRPIWNRSQGRVARIYGGVQDMTEWKQAMEALKESQQKFQCFFDKTEEGLALMNTQGFIIEWNQGAERLWGLKLFDVMGLALWDVVCDLTPGMQDDPAAYERVKTAMEAHLTTGGSQAQEWIAQEVPRADGSPRTIELLLFPIPTEKGVLYGAIMRRGG